MILTAANGYTMTFHIKEKLSRTIGFLIFYLALIAFGLYAGAKGENVQEYRIVLVLLFAFGGIAYLFKRPKETVITVVNKTITVTRVFRFKKNTSQSFTYGDIVKIESKARSDRYNGHYIYLRTGGSVRLPCGSDKGLDNFINNLVTERCAADPLFKAVRDEQVADDRSVKIFIIAFIVVSLLLAAVCWLIVGWDPTLFFPLWFLGVFLSFGILLIVSATQGAARSKKQIAELRAKDPQFDAAYVKHAVAKKEEQKKNDRLLIKISLFCVLLGIIGGAFFASTPKDIFEYGFPIALLSFFAFLVIGIKIKGK